jgi:hypothetical protein
MQLRRALAGALVLALAGLTSCGFDLATDRPYTPGEGTNEDSGDVKIRSALIVSAQPNGGTFIVTLVNSATTERSGNEPALTGISGPNLEVGEFEPIEVVPGQAVNLATEGGITISGDFDAGQALPLTLSFADGFSADLNVPVVTACDEYEGLDLTEASENIPYDCDYEPEHAGGEEH